MNVHKYLIIVKGADRTDSVESYNFENGKCYIKFFNNENIYPYDESNVQVFNLQNEIDPKSVIVNVDGEQITGIEIILDFGAFYRIFRKGKKDLLYSCDKVQFFHNCLSDPKTGDLFEYFKKIAESVSLVTENGFNILGDQYQKIKHVQDNTVLSSYLNKARAPQQRKNDSFLIYPFGLNQSQKKAVENAFSSQVSIIQGPPGTGKTQTILNIIANAVLKHKTVAVVSNNNLATKNVAEKLEKERVSFITAFLGREENKNRFLSGQCGQYPDMAEWELNTDSKKKLSEEVKNLSEELNKMLNRKNRIAEIERELLELQPEQHYFNEYYAIFEKIPDVALEGLTSKKILSLWLEYEQFAEQHKKLGLLKKISIFLRFNCSALKLFVYPPELVIPYLQNHFYVTKKAELQAEREEIESELDNYSFNDKMEELSQKSLRLFRAELANRYQWRRSRQIFIERDFWARTNIFVNEYPVILSTTYSIKKTLNREFVYDYLVIDEATQVDLATGVLAFSCAKNVVIVGDLKQLSNVVSEKDRQIVEGIWSRYSFDEMYHFSNYNLLSSAVARWSDAPSVMLREHYRCHPKIIGFCNQKFYQNQLIVMTEDHGEENVLMLYRTDKGRHEKGHLNQRQIDVIKDEVLPFLKEKGYRHQNIGIIAPYRKQIDGITKQIDGIEIKTIHKYQGREKEAIIVSTADDVIGDFVDSPNLLNVAVSRAVKTLVVIMSPDQKNLKTNYGDLVRYIEYNNCEIIDSAVFSIFDLLYKEYAQQRREYLQRRKRVSEYDSENLLYAVIEDILDKEPFQKISCAIHVSLATLIKNYSLLDEEEKSYARNPLTHTDFLLFNKMDKSPVMAIELDGFNFHKEGSKQAIRDAKKNSIFKKCGIPLLRISTNESGEHERIERVLKDCI